MYTFKAKVNRVMPNGIVNLTFDLGFGLGHTSNCLLHNIVILGDHEHRAGTLLREMLPIGSLVYVNSVKLDKHGRPIIKVYRYFRNGEIDKMSVNDYILLENLSW